MSSRPQVELSVRSEELSFSALCLPRWFPLARCVYRFLDHPVESSARLLLRAAGTVVRFAFLVVVGLGLLLFVML